MRTLINEGVNEAVNGEGLTKNDSYSPLILVIEDNSLYMRLVCDMLQARGYRTFEVTRLNLVIEAAQHQKPDLIFIDLQKGSFRVLNLVTHLRQHKQLQTIPIIGVVPQQFQNIPHIEGGSKYNKYVFRPISINKLIDQVGLQLIEAKKDK